MNTISVEYTRVAEVDCWLKDLHLTKFIDFLKVFTS